MSCRSERKRSRLSVVCKRKWQSNLALLKDRNSSLSLARALARAHAHAADAHLHTAMRKKTAARCKRPLKRADCRLFIQTLAGAQARQKSVARIMRALSPCKATSNLAAIFAHLRRRRQLTVDGDRGERRQKVNERRKFAFAERRLVSMPRN